MPGKAKLARKAAAKPTLLAGGKPVAGDGFYFEPTVLAVPGPGVPAFDEEELIGTTGRIFDGDEDAYLSLLGVINHYLDVTRRGPE